MWRLCFDFKIIMIGFSESEYIPQPRHTFSSQYYLGSYAEYTGINTPAKENSEFLVSDPIEFKSKRFAIKHIMLFLECFDSTFPCLMSTMEFHSSAFRSSTTVILNIKSRSDSVFSFFPLASYIRNQLVYTLSFN